MNYQSVTEKVDKRCRPFTAEHKLKISIANKGRIFSDEHRKKLSLSSTNIGKPPHPHKSGCKCFRCSGIAWNKGKPCMCGHKFKKGETSGAKNVNWRGGVTPVNESIRKTVEYRLWRKAVFLRDKFKCVWCGGNKKIEADHIKPFALFPELRYAIDNGRTLCEICHKSTDTYGVKCRTFIIVKDNN